MGWDTHALHCKSVECTRSRTRESGSVYTARVQPFTCGVNSTDSSPVRNCFSNSAFSPAQSNTQSWNECMHDGRSASMQQKAHAAMGGIVRYTVYIVQNHSSIVFCSREEGRLRGCPQRAQPSPLLSLSLSLSLCVFLSHRNPSMKKS